MPFWRPLSRSSPRRVVFRRHPARHPLECSSGVYLASQERAFEIGMRSNRFPPVLQQFAVVLTHIDQSVKVGTTLNPRNAMEQAR